MIKKEKSQGENPHVPAVLLVNESGILIDFLRDNLRGKSRDSIKSLLVRGAVLIEGHVTTRHDHPLHTGQSVQVRQAPQTPVAGGHALGILYEDGEFLIVDKPADLLSVANEKEKECTVYHQITEHVHQSDPDTRIFIVHRLDRDTSGVLSAAKTAEMKYTLQDQWGTLIKTRAYTTVVEGCPQPLSGRIHTRLYETRNTMIYSGGQGNDGLEAITDYKVIGISPEYSLVDIRLQSGRKNQIRIYMTEKGCPVVEDKEYGARSNPLKRLGLHAGVLGLRHPETGKLLRFEVGVPAVFLSISFQRTNIK